MEVLGFSWLDQGNAFCCGRQIFRQCTALCGVSAGQLKGTSFDKPEVDKRQLRPSVTRDPQRILSIKTCVLLAEIRVCFTLSLHQVDKTVRNPSFWKRVN